MYHKPYSPGNVLHWHAGTTPYPSVLSPHNPAAACSAAREPEQGPAQAAGAAAAATPGPCARGCCLGRRLPQSAARGSVAAAAQESCASASAALPALGSANTTEQSTAMIRSSDLGAACCSMCGDFALLHTQNQNIALGESRVLPCMTHAMTQSLMQQTRQVIARCMILTLTGTNPGTNNANRQPHTGCSLG